MSDEDLIQVTISPTQLPAGMAEDIDVRLTNVGPGRCTNVVFSLRLPVGLVLLKGTGKIQRSALDAGEFFNTSLRVTASGPGSYTFDQSELLLPGPPRSLTQCERLRRRDYRGTRAADGTPSTAIRRTADRGYRSGRVGPPARERHQHRGERCVRGDGDACRTGNHRGGKPSFRDANAGTRATARPDIQRLCPGGGYARSCPPRHFLSRAGWTALQSGEAVLPAGGT